MSVLSEEEKALCFQKTMLDDSSAQAIDKSRAPTRHRNVKFPAAARDIQTPYPDTGGNNDGQEYQESGSKALPDARMVECLYAFDIFFTASAEKKSALQQSDKDAENRSQIGPHGLRVQSIRIVNKRTALEQQGYSTAIPDDSRDDD
jgi:hypothetical protein